MMGTDVRSDEKTLSVEVRENLDAETRSAWDALVGSTDLSDVAQLSSWARLRATAGFSAMYILAWQGDELVGGAQILSRRIPPRGRIGYLPYGPLVSSGVPRAQVREALVAALSDCAARMSALFIQPPEGAEDVSADLLARGFRPSHAEIAPTASLRLDLRATEDQLRAGLKKTLRGWTGRWASRSVTVRLGDEDDIVAVGGLLANTAAHQGYEPLSVDYLLSYYRELALEGRVRLFIGEIAGRPTAARIYTVCGDVMKERLVGMDRSHDASRLRVPAAIEWHAILWAKSHGLRWLDFGGVARSTVDVLVSGSSVEPAEISGPDWFKVSFGGQPVVYPPAVEHVRSPLLRVGYDLVTRSGRAEEVMELLRRQIRGGRRHTRPSWPGFWNASLSRVRRAALAVLCQVFEKVVKPSYIRLRRGLSWLLFERRYGVRTEGRVPLSTFGIDDEHRSEYLPIGWLSMRRVLPRRSVGPEEVFIDIGSGMGRAVLIAATYPFRRVIGVELSPELHEVARANLNRNYDRLACKDVELVCADALDYKIPDDVTVVFLYNPFQGPIFERVVAKLIESVDSRPRTIRIVYANPVEEELLLATGRARLVNALSGMRPTKAWARSNAVRIYELGPQVQ